MYKYILVTLKGLYCIIYHIVNFLVPLENKEFRFLCRILQFLQCLLLDAYNKHFTWKDLLLSGVNAVKVVRFHVLLLKVPGKVIYEQMKEADCIMSCSHCRSSNRSSLFYYISHYISDIVYNRGFWYNNWNSECFTSRSFYAQRLLLPVNFLRI